MTTAGEKLNELLRNVRSPERIQIPLLYVLQVDADHFRRNGTHTSSLIAMFERWVYKVRKYLTAISFRSPQTLKEKSSLQKDHLRVAQPSDLAIVRRDGAREFPFLLCDVLGVHPTAEGGVQIHVAFHVVYPRFGHEGRRVPRDDAKEGFMGLHQLALS